MGCQGPIISYILFDKDSVVFKTFFLFCPFKLSCGFVLFIVYEHDWMVIGSSYLSLKPTVKPSHWLLLSQLLAAHAMPVLKL